MHILDIFFGSRRVKAHNTYMDYLPIFGGISVGSFKRLTAFLLVVCFLASSVAPVLAQGAEISGGGASVQMVGEVSAEVSVIAEPPVIPDVPTTPTNPINPTNPGSGHSQNPNNLLTPEQEGPKEMVSPTEVFQADLAPLITEEEVTEPEVLTEDETDRSKNEIKQQLVKVNQYTGALQYSIPIVVPPGRNGMQPTLSLDYSSQPEQHSNIAGYGWSLSIPSIERINRRGSDKMFYDTYFTSSLSGELASTSATTYVAKVDTGDFLNYTFQNNVWTVTDKQGTTYTFGQTASERQDNTASSSQIFKWMLNRVEDLNGNYITYEYVKDKNQIYPSTITYTGHGANEGIFEVEFVRESRPDVLQSASIGFMATTSQRIKEVITKVNGTWVRKYALGYELPTDRTRSLLTTVTESGQDENSAVTTLQPYTFDYQTSGNPGWEEISAQPDFSFIKAGAHHAELNGDGLPDIIRHGVTQGGSHKRVIQLHTGTEWATSTEWTVPDNLVFYDGSLGTKDRGARVVDVNGDGRDDFVRCHYQVSQSTPLLTFINNGSELVEDTTTWVPPISCNVSSDRDSGVRLMDVNGDNLVDFVRYREEYPNDDYVFLNTGAGWESQPLQWPTPIRFTGENYHNNGSMIIDLNGDGYPDVLKSEDFAGTTPPEVKEQALHMGVGWQSTPIWVPPGYHYFSFEKRDYGFRPADVNGDGLTDILDYTGYGDLQYTNNIYINKGDGNWVNLDDEEEWSLPVAFVSQASTDVGTRIIDFNADGLPDLMKADSDNHTGRKVWLNTSEKEDLLKVIGVPTGATTTIEYKSSHDYRDGNDYPLSSKMPFPIQTVSKITTNDGITTPSEQTYVYADGFYYYNTPHDRKFTGFGLVTETDQVGNVTKTYFHQGNTSSTTIGEYTDHIAKAGKTFRVEQYNANNSLFSKTISKWDHATTSDGVRVFVKLADTVTFTYDGDSDHKEKAESYTYNTANGNISQKIDWGEVTGSNDGTFSDTGSDKFTTTVVYATSTATSTITLPSQDTMVDQSSNKVSETKTYYDTLSYGSLNKGNATKQEFWKSGSTYIDTEKTYNSYGLVTQEKDGRDKATNYTYDAHNLHIATSTNAKSQATHFYYDYSLGKPKEVIDANGRRFTTTYDGLDRVTEEKQPDLTTPTTLVTKTQYVYTDTGFPQKVQQKEYLDATNIVDTYTYLDGFARPIQTRHETETSNTYAVSDVQYDARGLKKKESLPYFGTGSSRTSPTSTENLYTRYVYDALQRVTDIGTAVGTTTYAYDDWKTTIEDPRGVEKDLYTDARGNLIQVDEHNGASTYTTTYQYNGLNNLTKITDALGNIRNFTYDGLGRRLTAEDLHASGDTSFGTWQYVYDDAGNLLAYVDPKSQGVVYTYDDLNRVVSEDFAAQSGVEIGYAYDAGTDGIGRLTSATTSSATTTYTYNPVGSTKTEAKLIDGTTYTTEYAYDRQGNVYTIKNPDNSIIKYDRNTGGQVETVKRKESNEASYKDVIDDLDYGPHGKITYMEFDGYANTTNTYDATKLYRLENRTTLLPFYEIGGMGMMSQGNSQGGGISDPEDPNGSVSLLSEPPSGYTKIQDLTYTYDAVGNITKIVDNADTNTKKTVDYTYDDLSRLLSASSTGAVAHGNYRQVYSYTAVGNIATTTLTTTAGTATSSYAYAGHTGSLKANPHAATTITSSTTQSFDYDANGNVGTTTVNGATTTYIWNYRNQLTQAATSSTLATFGYDHTGDRVKLVEGGTTTYFPSAQYEVSGGAAKKYIYLGDQLVAIGENGAHVLVHTDHLGGTQVISGTSDTIAELNDYYPFGSLRFNEQASYSNRKKFTGHEYDGSSGLSYMEARYQNGNQGRFISQDPAYLQVRFDLADPQSLNAYAYARNNPLVYLDPNGESFKNFHLYLAGYIRGGANTVIGGVETVYNSYAHPITTGNQIIQSTKNLGESLQMLATDPRGTLSGGLDALLEKSPMEQGEIAGGIGVSGTLITQSITGTGATRSAVALDEYGAVGNKIPQITKSGLPTSAQNALKQYEANGWNQLPGYSGGRVFGNNERYLPIKESGYYREWDTNPLQPGVSRGNERFVTGRGGEVYWTDTHYGTNPNVNSRTPFHRVKPGSGSQ
jgi:RHS repeat-associated protein